jgi:hypothetical protein
MIALEEMAEKGEFGTIYSLWLQEQISTDIICGLISRHPAFKEYINGEALRREAIALCA